MYAVTMNVIDGKIMYAVYKKKYEDEPLHAGNMEMATNYIKDEAAAERIAEILNNIKE